MIIQRLAIVDMQLHNIHGISYYVQFTSYILGTVMFTSSIYMAVDMDSSGYDIVELRLSHPLSETATVYISILDEGRMV